MGGDGDGSQEVRQGAGRCSTHKREGGKEKDVSWENEKEETQSVDPTAEEGKDYRHRNEKGDSREGKGRAELGRGFEGMRGGGKKRRGVDH